MNLWLIAAPTVVAIATLGASPKPIMSSWTDIYPPSEIAAGHKGVTYSDVSIDAEGRPFACAIIVSSNWPKLDAQACKLLGHIRYQPARDESGRAVPSVYRATYRWELPQLGEAPLPFPPVADVEVTVSRLPGGARAAMVQVRQIVATDGSVESCTIEKSDAAALDVAACEQARQYAPQAILHDKDGRAVRGQRTWYIRFKSGSPASG